MSAPPYQKLFWGSYHKHTAHLRTAKEHGAYLLLIGALWNNEGRLPADDETLAGHAMMTVKEWEAIKPKLMRPTLLKIVRGKLTQARVTEDLAKYRDTSCKRKQAGKNGGIASAGNKRENLQAIATVLPTKPEPEPEPKEESADALFVVETTKAPAKPMGKRRQYPADMEAAWAAYPHHPGRSSKPNVLTQWKALPDDERAQMLSAIAAFRPKVAEVCGGKGAPDMARWLKDGKHLAWMSQAAPLLAASAPRWPGPPKILAAAIADRPKGGGEAWAISWLGRCGYRVEDGAHVITCPSQRVLDRIRQDAPSLEARGARLIVEPPGEGGSVLPFPATARSVA